MDSYLANIDNYMKQQQQQELLLKRQRQQQQMLLQQQQLQQQQQQQQQHNISLPPPPQIPQQQMSDDWLRNMSNLSVGASADPMFPNHPLYMSNTSTTSAYNNNNSNNYSLPPMQQSNNANYLQPLQSLQQQQIPPPGFDINGQPIRIRKKPGRKPNPASPALRKAQNRAAQRAFRERKERHLKDLETTIRNLREQRNNATRELNAVKANLESYKAESWYLKGVVLTLQFVCMHHNIQIPAHSPYLAEDALAKIAQIAPHAIEAYVNSYTRNNTNLKSTMSYHFVDKNDGSPLEQQQQRRPSTVGVGSPPPFADDERDHDEDMDGEDEFENYTLASPPPAAAEAPVQQQPGPVKKEEDNSRLDWLKQLDDKPPSSPPNQQQQQQQLDTPTSSLDAINQIRLKLGVQSALNDSDDQAAVSRLKPTILQLAIPHDPRIDLVPTPHMRDRMIIFRDQMDYDRCFTMLLNGAVYHGGDPTMSENWELPADFFSDFWYLCIDYDIKKTNKWRRKKGLADVAPGPQQNTSTNDAFCNDEAFDQIVRGMPALQPMNRQTGYPLSPPKSQLELANPENKNSPKYMYRVMMTAPESRPHIADASLENIVHIISKQV